MNLDMLIKVGLTEEEEHFLKQTRDQSSRSESAQTLTKVMIEMYSIKHAEKNTNALIDSNKKLAESNDKHAKAMRYLTTALVVVALIQVIVAIIALL